MHGLIAYEVIESSHTISNICIRVVRQELPPNLVIASEDFDFNRSHSCF